MKKQAEEFSLTDFFAIFIPKLWLIVAIAIVFAAAFGGYTMFFTDDTYTSSILLQVEKLPDDSNKSTSTTELSFARNALPTIKYYLTTEDFLDKIIEYLPANGFTDEISRESIKSMVSLSVIEDTELLNIDVTSTDPELSLNIAKAYAGIVPADVMAMYKNVEVEIRNAPRTGEANSRGTVRNTIIGFLGGAILAVIGVFVFSMLDVTVHDRKKIEENFDLPVLGVIPKVDNPVSSKGDK